MSERRGEWPIKLNKLTSIPHDASLALRIRKESRERQKFSSITGLVGETVAEDKLLQERKSLDV